MQRKTGSLMELFTCRNCKKRRHIRPSKDNAPGANVTHKNAPQPRPSRDPNENAPATTTSTAPSVGADDDERWQTTAAERARNGKHLEPSSKSIFYDIGILQIDTSSNVELTPESPQSILKNPESPLNHKKSRHSSASERRARFKEAVDVIVHDNHGNAIAMDRVKLKSAADDSARSPPGECDRKRLSLDDDRASSVFARRRSVFSLRSMRVELDGNGRRYLRLVVALGDAFTERTIHVCTARGGSRILVGAYKPEPLGDGTNYLRQYIDRFQLPHPVDALSIRGELDRSGELVITAPLFDFEGESIDAGRPHTPSKRTSSL